MKIAAAVEAYAAGVAHALADLGGDATTIGAWARTLIDQEIARVEASRAALHALIDKEHDGHVASFQTVGATLTERLAGHSEKAAAVRAKVISGDAVLPEAPVMEPVDTDLVVRQAASNDLEPAPVELAA